jgi:hypothetical protein
MIERLPDLRPHTEQIARRLFGTPNERLSTRRQLRFGSNGSLAVEIAGAKRGQWYDHEAVVGGGPWELLTIKGSMTNGAAVGWLQTEFGIEIKPARTSRVAVAIYDYRNEQGELLFQVCRFEPKDFRQRRPDGKGCWIWKVQGTRQVPYRLPELLAAPSECIVFTVEGEKDADRLASLGFVATCNAGGAAKRREDGKAGKPKWPPELNLFFQGRDVVILPDNDDAGRDHAHAVAANLAPVAARVRILELPGLPTKGDVSDWLDAGGTSEELQRLTADAPRFQREGGAEAPLIDDKGDFRDDEAEIARLAKLSPIQGDRELPAVAEKLGCLVSTLRAEVKAARGESEASPGQGRPLDLPEPELWPEPVDGAALLDELARVIRQYVILWACQCDAVALWNVFTHAFDAFDFSPKLVIRSPEKRSGKTRLVEVSERVARRPLFTSGITAAALLRVIEQRAPTMLLDEIDTLMKGDAEMAEALRGLINSSFTRAGARFIKNVPTADGGFEPRAFSTWCPMLLAGIGKLPDTIADRSIIIEMTRKRSDEKVKRLRARDGRELQDLALKAARWAADNLNALERADPQGAPEQLHDREADAWSPLLAVADAAGGEWPERARKAAIELSVGEDAETTREMLLRDIRAAFDARKFDRLSSDDLVAYLTGLDDRPWPEINRGKPLTKVSLAGLLKPFKIRSRTIRLGDGRTPKGYYRRTFEDIFTRYLSHVSEQSATTPQTRKSAAFGENQNATSGDCVAFRNRENPSVSADCGVVADPNPLLWRDKL